MSIMAFCGEFGPVTR